MSVKADDNFAARVNARERDKVAEGAMDNSMRMRFLGATWLVRERLVC